MADGDNRDVATALVEFARGLAEDQTVEAVLEDLGDSCAKLLSVDGVGVLLLEDRDLSVATTNNPIGDAIEQLEAELHEGPCVECVRTGQPVFVDDLLLAADRYPTFVPRALDAGARAIHALPLTGRGEVLGALDIVNREPHELSADDLAIAQMLADVAVSYIFAVRLHEESSKLASQLQHALDARVIIEQAKGMLSERHGEALSASFERLRSHARSHNLTVREVARRTIDRELAL